MVKKQRVRDLLKNETPCAVVCFLEWFKMDRNIENRKYELMIVSEVSGNILYRELDATEVSSFLSEHSFKFDVAEDNENGTVWDYGGFRKLGQEAEERRKEAIRIKQRIIYKSK